MLDRGKYIRLFNKKSSANFFILDDIINDIESSLIIKNKKDALELAKRFLNLGEINLYNELCIDITKLDLNNNINYIM